MRNERGLTLLEIMAAISISLLVLTAGTMLFLSVTSASQSSSQRYLDDSSVKNTVNFVSKLLNDSNKAVYYPALSELRIHTGGDGYKSLILTGTQYKLYRFGGTAADFASSAVSITANPSLYTPQTDISGIVKSAGYQYYNGTAYADMISGSVLSQGELLAITYHFNTTRINIYGRSTVSEASKTVKVKLLIDTTTK